MKPPVTAEDLHTDTEYVPQGAGEFVALIGRSAGKGPSPSSFLFKNHSLAPAYQLLLAGRPLAVSVISVAEIRYGMEVKNWGTARLDLMHRFRRNVYS